MLHQIGVGALGPVFRTYEPDRDRLVAVKLFRLDITPEQARALADELSKGADAGLFHPSIVEPIAAGVEGSMAYGAEEYVAAESLDVAMRDYAPAPVAMVLPLITQLAGAIDFARAAGVGHGALHPRDIFVTSEEVRATGFGVVEALERVGLRAPVRRPYSAPERIERAAWSTPADVFSLAAIAFELLTGRRPAGLGTEIGPLTSGTPNGWTEALHAVLARAMDPDPARRYPTALGLASALEAAARGNGEVADVPGAAVVHALAATGDAESDADERAPSEPSDPVVPEAADVIVAPAVASAPPSTPEAGKVDEAFVQADDWREPEPADAWSLREEDVHDVSGVPVDVQESAAARAFADDFREPLDAFRPRDVDDREPDPVAPRPTFDPAEDARRFHATGDPADDTADAAVVEAGLWASEGRPPAREVPTPGAYARAFEDEDVESELAPLPEERRGLWMAAVLLVVGLVGGLAAGYILWGRAPSPGTAVSVPGAPVDEVAPAPHDAATSDGGPALPAVSGRPATPPPADAPPGLGEREAVATAAPVESRPARGRLIVRSTPGGAGVTVNGTWRGRTPLTLDDLPFARYQVRVVEPGFAVASHTVTLSAGSPEGTVAVQLVQQTPPAARGTQPAGRGTPPAARGAQTPQPRPAETFTGAIYVDSRPRGATVSINGKPAGVTPLRIPEMRIGTHVVRLELPDHQIWSSTARVTAGQEVRVTGSLDPIR